MNIRDGLAYREDYFNDPADWRAIKDLLRDIFNVDIDPLDRLGGPDWTNMPSAYFDRRGRCIANLSAFSMPLTINGREIAAAGLQSGAVRPEYRGHGLFRDLTLRTLARCDEKGFETVVLYTDKPGLYERHGFVAVPQYGFAGTPPRPQPAHKPAARKLSLDIPADLVLLKRLLAQRAPVSNRFAVLRQMEMFLLNAVLIEGVELALLDDFPAIVAWREGEGGRFELLDVAGPSVPSLAEILTALEADSPHVTVSFPPDRLDWAGEAIADDGNLTFMMRCRRDLIPTEPFCLSPMAEF
ncbi:MAG: GNAT family N-acetyltransferase [Shinella sp.]|nr:GNAT family N-acetyltransferase [Shinella sp.]